MLLSTSYIWVQSGALTRIASVINEPGHSSVSSTQHKTGSTAAQPIFGMRLQEAHLVVTELTMLVTADAT